MPLDADWSVQLRSGELQPAIAGDGITNIGVSGVLENTLNETDTVWNILRHTFLYVGKLLNS